MATERVIRREILDHLPAGDASAVRARADLRKINALMGNVRWMKKSLVDATQRPSKFPSKLRSMRLVELGAGEGHLCAKLSKWFPEAAVTGLDLAPRPPGLPPAISWRQGNLLDELGSCDGETLLGVMILHHFSEEDLGKIGKMATGYRSLCFCEPWRARFPHLLGAFISPFFGRVTHHDLPASIDAGFVPGELPELLGLESWHIEESVDCRGSLRFRAWKK